MPPTRLSFEQMLLIALAGLLCLNVGLKFAIFTRIPDNPISIRSGIAQKDPVLLLSSNHEPGPYGFTSDQEWAALVPGNGTVHVSPHHQPFMVSMFHQFRCMDVVRMQLRTTKERRDMQYARHCLNYLRQMTLCRGDTFIDPFEYLSKKGALARHPVRRCKDWRALYEAVTTGQESSSEWLLGFPEHVVPT
ncbi:hypothetical protein OBBRIDRAFT_807074 [Obba rivulosa]|uniref:Uncharacterized protein n=1 Tax=Obba rivulosa TaxID=1052685 RepID=A0A8E2AMH5_9APHY|nr:hypothetical protein OBBRIDRAFT_807074 [Obba rivulosa]